ncbi:uncharacterized protein LOC120453344 [Drosophila santomea]|uniref:uncharacterized protein LOC120453344 n=1 Tax=Drosophila santomea TaxID=129105 RepID=UPI001954679F|nr:uncharacterized protein LOC120453344 [Drosophila santomea]XP_039493947.1 uncharacterized protein LOC120453344 [Drosophila santomea]XP_039493948.1 uncharacterized protein LOC120453344 [Drosophila santomea]
MRSTILVLLWLGAISSAVGNQTHLAESSLEHRILSRRVRALVFPDKAALLLTAALTKLILGGRPSGLQYSLEFDMYVPVPDTIEGWQPKILKKPKPMPMPKRRFDWSYSKGPVSYYPNYYPNYYESPAINKVPFYQTKSSPAFTKDSFYQTHWQSSSPTNRRQDVFKSRPTLNRASFYQTPLSLSANQLNPNQPKEEVYESWDQVPSWKLHRGYRERREIFDQFEAMEKVFQLDLRSCIKRAMCELRAKLNAGQDQGFLMEDLMRIVLTVPEEVTDDKYRHRMDIQDCARFYAPSCPYNVLDFLTQSSAKL